MCGHDHRVSNWGRTHMVLLPYLVVWPLPTRGVVDLMMSHGHSFMLRFLAVVVRTMHIKYAVLYIINGFSSLPPALFPPQATPSPPPVSDLFFLCLPVFCWGNIYHAGGLLMEFRVLVRYKNACCTTLLDNKVRVDTMTHSGSEGTLLFVVVCLVRT